MTAAMWILSVLLCIAITLIVMGAVLRPYVADMQKQINHWKLRAEVAEHEIEMTQGRDVRLVPQIDAAETLDVWMKGVTDEV